MAWFDATGESDDGPYTISPSPLTFSYITPDPEGDEIPPERMEWEYTVPSVEDGLYKLKVEIDSESNNTEDPDTSIIWTVLTCVLEIVASQILESKI